MAAAAAHDTEPSSPTTAASSVSAAKGEFLKLFWTLAESDVATRTRAAAQLLAYLRDNADDVEYTLKRLVRGLASSRDAARQGFSAALAALLVEFPDAITLDATLQLLQDAMEVSASMKAMEQREHMFGKLFGLLALHRSGRLARDEDATVAVLTQLAEMSKWKKWLREACVEAMLTVLSDVPKKLFVARVAAPLGALLEGDVAAFNADQVALAVGLHHYIQTHKIAADALPADYPALHFVRRKHMHALVEPLKHSTACFPRVHGAWYGLFGHIMHAGSDGAKLDSELFQEAWTVLVENVLLHAATTTHERKGLALKLFELVLPALPSAVLRAILTPNLVKCLFNNTLSKKTYLHDAVRHTLKAFATHAPAEFFHFFQREFVQPMPTLVEGAASDAADDDELKAAVKSGGFDAIIAIEEERERQAALLRKYSTVRLWALEHLVGELTELINGEPDAAAQQLRDRVLEFLSFHAFFKPSAAAAKTTPPTKKNKKSKAAAPAATAFETPVPTLSVQVREALVKKLFSLLSVKLSNAEDATLSKVFSTVFGMIESGSQELRAPLDDAQRALVASVQSHVASLRAKAADAKDATDDAFALLFQSCALQLVDASQREDAQGVVADLEKCFVDMQAQKNKGKATKKSPSKKASKKKADADEEAGDESSEPVDAVVVLTDLLLSLLSQDSSAMREIVTHVFRDLVPLMTPQSLQTLVAALAPSAAGEEDEEKPEGDDDEERDEDMGEEDEEEEEEEVVLSSAADIADALRSDENLAELHREDQTLSAIVGQVKTKAKAKKDAKKHRLQVLHFKLRVVDLLALYASAVHKDEAAASGNNAVRLVLPLFESLTAIASSDVEQRVLKDRLQAVLLHKFVRGAKEAAQPAPADRAECVRATQSVVELLSKKALDKELATKVGAAVVVHLMRAAAGDAPDAKTVKALQEIAQTAARDVFTKKHAKFPRAVFDELIAKHAKLAVHVLLPALAQIASASATESEHAAVDDFSKAEVFRLLSLLLKPKHVAEAGERRVFDAHRETLLSALVALLQHKKADDEDAQKSGSSEMKAKRLKVFLSFALHLTRTWRELTGDEAELAALVGVVQSLETSSPVVKNMVKQLSQAAGVEAADAAEPVAATPTKKQKTNAATAVNGEKKTKSKTKSPTPATSTKTKKSEKKKSPTPAKRKRSNSTADDVDDE